MTFWFGASVVLFCTIMSLVGDKIFRDEWYIVIKAYNKLWRQLKQAREQLQQSYWVINYI